MIFLFGCVAWSLWLIRNDFVFNDVVITSPVVALFRAISYMQRWKILSKGEDRRKLEEVIEMLKLQSSVLQHPDC